MAIKALFIIIIIFISLIVIFIWFQFKPQVVPDNYLWIKFWDDKEGVEFEYPKELSTKFISVVNWPPQVQVFDQPFTCTEAGFETDRAGQTEKKTISGYTYCVTRRTEGGAGSIYTMYKYSFSNDGKTVVFTFSFRFSQCGNYDEAQKTECENERRLFDIDKIMDRVARSAKFF